MTGVSVVSRDWDEVADVQPALESGNSLGTSAHDQQLHEPLRGWNAFSTTFLVMFKEEGRKSLEFAKKRQIVLFPLLLTLITALTTVGLQFLVGDSSAQVSDIDQKKVDRIKQALENGEFPVDTARIAEKMTSLEKLIQG